jgi:hypothetical protein
MSFIPAKAANCDCCGSFQMHLNWDFIELKMEGFQRLCELRWATEDRIDSMFGKYDIADIELYKAKRAARQELYKDRLMNQIENNEYFLLN